MTSKDAHVVQTNVTQKAVVVHSTGEHAVSFETFLVEGAVVVSSAGRQTHAVPASVAFGTFRCRVAGQWHSNALHVVVAGESRRTGALFVMVEHSAFCVHATS